MEFGKSQPKWSDCHKKTTYRLNFRPQMWPVGLTLAMILTLNFQGQIWNLLCISQKWSDCHETKSKHIDWTLGLKYDQWAWTWPWPWIFKVKCDLELWLHAWPWPWIFMEKHFEIPVAVSQDLEGQLTLNKGDWSRSIITMADIWIHNHDRHLLVYTPKGDGHGNEFLKMSACCRLI